MSRSVARVAMALTGLLLLQDAGFHAQSQDRESGLPAGIRPEDTCAYKDMYSGGSGCWQENDNSPGCFLWHYLWNPLDEDAVTWTGDCSDGLASGSGTMEVRRRGFGSGVGSASLLTGQLQNGKMQVLWTTLFVDGTFFGEGLLVDGEAQGHWKEAMFDDGVGEGPYVDDERNGRWTLRFSDGSVWEGPYVGDRKNGQWTERDADGWEDIGPYVDGKRNGRWTLRHADGDVRYECYSNGDKVDCP